MELMAVRHSCKVSEEPATAGTQAGELAEAASRGDADEVWRGLGESFVRWSRLGESSVRWSRLGESCDDGGAEIGGESNEDGLSFFFSLEICSLAAVLPGDATVAMDEVCGMRLVATLVDGLIATRPTVPSRTASSKAGMEANCDS